MDGGAAADEPEPEEKQYEFAAGLYAPLPSDGSNPASPVTISVAAAGVGNKKYN